MLIVLAGVSLCFFVRQKYDCPETKPLLASGPIEKMHQSNPADKEFYDTVYGFVGKDIDLSTANVVAGVGPHHLLAGDMIAEFYHNYAGLDFDTVVLLGPNHFLAGRGQIITSDYDWQTPFGRLEVDKALLAKLQLRVGASIEPEVIAGDHAITSQTAFIKKTFPLAKFVPLLLSPENIPVAAENLAEALFILAREQKILLIASVDFSHYQDSQTAIQHDQASITTLQVGDLAQVYNLNIDSPPSIYTLLKYSQLQGKSFQLLNNSNSALLSGQADLKSTTSYVTGYFVDTKEEIKMLFLGDLMLDRYVGDQIKSKGLDYLLADLAKDNFFSAYDVLSANLEGTVTNQGQHYAPVKAYDFAFLPEQIAKLKDYGFNFFTVANNHFYDQGERGVGETRQNLEDLGFDFVGSPNGMIDDYSLRVLDINNKKIAMVGLSSVFVGLDKVKLKSLMDQAGEQSEMVIVNIHWGEEYKQKFNSKQQVLAHQLIDLGADIIIGHHPHVVQGLEIYKNKPIFYSVGNFIFDCSLGLGSQLRLETVCPGLSYFS